ncbi:hypothetical protein [Mycobacteroides saopaulense]|uniref:NfeD-like C-terminal domain-containing protein n=1 Tax=Mycobacteroides saopaulense TaxID=1578165 RepID=A0A1X0JDF6_9MYCO|nr:hypothetical protein [Mycobacteroides saopaulense]OHT88785.1 hypothetical protein BKG68_02565 [Mycobacteroides saopaulense]OHU13605.1 hypothetical protein BKG73_02570 [Mycobacteroides saopaulense]ORB60535.1 hypothetical protein BST43_03110 [Mycobacteroides saopaulense]
MDGLTVGYLAAFAVGGIAVLSALLLTDIGHGDGMPFLSLTSLSAALTGAGAGGFAASALGITAVPSAIIAAVCAVALVLILQLFLTYLRGQQANSHSGRASYVGRLGTVTLEVPAGGGWGEIAFTDADGNRVRSRAITDEPEGLAKNAAVYIADVDSDYLHVVSIPDSPTDSHR